MSCVCVLRGVSLTCVSCVVWCVACLMFGVLSSVRVQSACVCLLCVCVCLRSVRVDVCAECVWCVRLGCVRFSVEVRVSVRVVGASVCLCVEVLAPVCAVLKRHGRFDGTHKGLEQTLQLATFLSITLLSPSSHTLFPRSSSRISLPTVLLLHPPSSFLFILYFGEF